MKSWRPYLPFALFLAFLSAALIAFFQSRPAPKNERVYQALKPYTPYYLDKRFGGLTIRSKTDESFKEKPTNMTLFKEFEHLERTWGKSHLKLLGKTLLILDDNGSIKAKLPLETEEEQRFIRDYYGVE